MDVLGLDLLKKSNLKNIGFFTLSLGMFLFALATIYDLEEYYLNWVAVAIILIADGMLFFHFKKRGENKKVIRAISLGGVILVSGLLLFFVIP